jgi:glycerol-3-phosphate dehydrogenase
MKRNLNKLASTEYDVIIIGGGMFGACALWEAAHRGLSACLIERGDFCEATSANHYKMVHGGIRYIQHGDLIRLRESSVERSAFLRIAPHLVTPLPILIPTFGHGMKGKEILRTGMFLYDLITADRNYKITDHDRHIPPCYTMSKEEVLNLYPGVKQDKLTGAAVFNDAQMYNPARLVLSFIKSAFELGADAANYIEAEKILIKNNKCFGVRAKDNLTSNVFDVKGKCVLNTAGPWAAGL